MIFFKNNFWSAVPSKHDNILLRFPVKKIMYKHNIIIIIVKPIRCSFITTTCVRHRDPEKKKEENHTFLYRPHATMLNIFRTYILYIILCTITTLWYGTVFTPSSHCKGSSLFIFFHHNTQAVRESSGRYYHDRREF